LEERCLGDCPQEEKLDDLLSGKRYVGVAKMRSKKPKFLFISPPYERLMGFAVQSVPLGLLYVATVLTENGYEAKVYDAETSFTYRFLRYSSVNRARSHVHYLDGLQDANHEVWHELIRIIEQEDPDIVGVSIMTPTYRASQKVVSITRQQRPSCTILVGGPHVTICGKEIMTNKDIDFAFSGEAEESIVSFAKAFETDKDFANIRGIIFRQGGAVVDNGISDRIDDLDALPIPNKDLLIFRERYDPNKLAGMIASRGCPYKCQFCAVGPLWGQKVRLRSPGNVLKEIDDLVEKYRITGFDFWDDTFTASKRSVVQFCEGLVQRYGEKRFRWSCITSLRALDENVLRALKRAGCWRIRMGVESGSDRVLEKVEKGITTAQVRRAAKLVKENGFALHTYFMIGFPYETEEDIRKTIDFMQEIKPDTVNLCTFTPYPGTKLYDYVIKHNLLERDPDYRIFDEIGHHSEMGYFAHHIPRERYLELLSETLDVSTRLTDRITLKKIVDRGKGITWKKIRNRARAVFNRVMSAV